MALSLTKPRTPGSVRYRTSPPTCSVLLSSFGSSSTILPDNDGDPRKLVHKVSDRIKGNFDAVVSVSRQCGYRIRYGAKGEDHGLAYDSPLTTGFGPKE